MTDDIKEETTANVIDQNGKENIYDVSALERPEFYHEKISYIMGSNFNQLNRNINKVNLFLETSLKDDVSQEERLQFSVARSEALDESDKLMLQMREFMNIIIKSIPRSWLIDGAPKKIGDGEWLNYVRRDRFVEVGEAYQSDGVRRREETKN